MVSTIIAMSTFLRPGYLIRRHFAVIIITVLPRGGKPGLHMGKRPKYPLHYFYFIAVEIVFGKLTVYRFVKVCTADPYHCQNRSQQTRKFIFVIFHLL